MINRSAKLNLRKQTTYQNRIFRDITFVLLVTRYFNYLSKIILVFAHLFTQISIT